MALIVVAIVLTGGLRLFTLQAVTADRVGTDARMGRLASDLLAQDGALGSNSAGTNRGETGDILWTIERLPFEPEPQAGGRSSRLSGGGPRLLLVRATVTGATGGVTLSTLRLVPKG